MKLFELYVEDEFDNRQFEKDCAFYLKKMGHLASEVYMFRGTESERIKVGGKNTWRPRESPVDTPGHLHKMLNDYYNEEFGKPFRNGMFVTGSIGVAETYGEPYVVVPIGEFEWLSNPEFEDMYTFIKDIREEHNAEETQAMVLEAVQDSKRWKHNKDLPGCISSMSEIALWLPNGFYLFDKSEGLPPAIS